MKISPKDLTLVNWSQFYKIAFKHSHEKFRFIALVNPKKLSEERLRFYFVGWVYKNPKFVSHRFIVAQSEFRISTNLTNALINRIVFNCNVEPFLTRENVFIHARDTVFLLLNFKHNLNEFLTVPRYNKDIISLFLSRLKVDVMSKRYLYELDNFNMFDLLKTAKKL